MLVTDYKSKIISDRIRSQKGGKSAARGRPIIVEWERRKHSAGLSRSVPPNASSGADEVLPSQKNFEKEHYNLEENYREKIVTFGSIRGLLGCLAIYALSESELHRISRVRVRAPASVQNRTRARTVAQSDTETRTFSVARGLPADRRVTHAALSVRFDTRAPPVRQN
ncbi:hypothetical protein EVAR_91496_1 [Eumeta japonica]|uniref:Uncharacterized protein n=1 Tax=Eumeta variegata TaxID=151549 RepID=A0A4C1VE82_EUMVA|nr:hypothetical protein EVAR_91496_1 [Eumeta japonica]